MKHMYMYEVKVKSFSGHEACIDSDGLRIAGDQSGKSPCLYLPSCVASRSYDMTNSCLGSRSGGGADLHTPVRGETCFFF